MVKVVHALPLLIMIKSFMLTSSPRESGQLVVSEFSEPENIQR